jgi:hypothetical protein
MVRRRPGVRAIASTSREISFISSSNEVNAVPIERLRPAAAAHRDDDGVIGGAATVATDATIGDGVAAA